MFGYVIPNKNELKIREFETYNSYYCAVCHSIRDRYGQIPRLLLTYDSVFLAMLLSSPEEKEDEISKFRCGTHPGKERNITAATPEIDYAADMMILLGYYNLRDDYEDDKSFLGLIGSKYLKGAYQKIYAKHPEKSSFISTYMNRISEIEKKGTEIFDEVAEPFSQLMEEIFDYDSEYARRYNDNYKAIGFHLGKWIYLIDAFDDLEKDLRFKSFNPLISQFGYNQGEFELESLEDFKKRIKDRILLNLELYLANIGEQVNKIPLKKNKEIIANIVFLGLRGKTEDILSERSGNK